MSPLRLIIFDVEKNIVLHAMHNSSHDLMELFSKSAIHFLPSQSKIVNITKADLTLVTHS